MKAAIAEELSIAALVCAALVLLMIRWLTARRARRFAAEEARRITCPRTARDVACVLVHDRRTGQWTSVETCSAFEDGKPTCDQDCLRILNRGIPLTPSQAPGAADVIASEITSEPRPEGAPIVLGSTPGAPTR